MNNKQRFAIDNAGNLFASVTTSKRRPRFRFIAVLTEDVDPAVLGRALDMTVRRFPYFNVELKSGFFWHYLEESEQNITLQRDFLDSFQTLIPQGPLLHIGYDGRKINLEMAHVLSDGFGGVTFLKTLLVQYYRLRGIDVPFTHGALNTDETPRPEEYEDSYKKYSRKALKPAWTETRTFRPESVSRMSQEVSVLTGIMNTQDVLKKARAYQVSVTDYLGAVLVQSLYMLQSESKPRVQRPVKISVSADLRKFYPTATLRNFSGFCNAGITPAAGACTLREIMEEVHHQCKWMLTEKNLNAQMSEHTRVEKNILIRAVPLFMKKRIATLILDQMGSQTASMDFTNMGAMELPEAIRDKVERFDTIGGNLHCFKIECGVISYRDTLSICFSRVIDQPLVENHFFDTLAAEGIPVRLEDAGRRP